MRRQQRVSLGKDLLLQILALGQVFLHEVRARQRLCQRGGESQLPFGGQGRAIEPPQRAAGIGQHFGRRTRHFGAGVVDRDIHPVQHKPRRPAGTDHPTADHRDLVEPCHHPGHSLQRFVSFNFARASAGVRIRAPIPVRICTARSTSWPLLASCPRPR